MNYPYLATGYSQALQNLIDSGSPPTIQAVEYGPYHTPSQVLAAMRKLNQYSPYFHPGSMIRTIPWHPGKTRQFETYLSITQTPWISLHISLKPVWMVWLERRLGIHFPTRPNPQRITTFIRKIKRLQSMYALPFLLEFMPASSPKDLLVSDSVTVCRILEETGCSLLLDIPHARINAFARKISFEAYCQSLLLERTREIHISGLRPRDGFLYDAHQSIQSEDLDCLNWVLQYTNPELITLEYYYNAESLQTQLQQLSAAIKH
ncbi:MAG: hypothetical protein CVU39_04505 [Chloroflexi bacterium HGW-Chloroflexi-10]|nr:MAG: hypothetical protein CVU39_04505 [Chloroflexi bacterium HGW-Chloroflexi-10]